MFRENPRRKSLWACSRQRFLRTEKAHSFLFKPASTIHSITIPLLGLYPRGVKTYIHIMTCTVILITASFTRAPNWKLQCASANEQINTRECHCAVKTGACNMGTVKIIMPRERCWHRRVRTAWFLLQKMQTSPQWHKVIKWPSHTQNHHWLPTGGRGWWREGPQRDPGTLWEVMEMFCI